MVFKESCNQTDQTNKSCKNIPETEEFKCSNYNLIPKNTVKQG